MKTVDVHCHVVPPDFGAVPAGCGGEKWPQMVHRDDGSAAVVIAGKEFRRLDGRSWDLDRRRTDMDAEDVALQVLSPMPELLSYWLEPAASLAMCRLMNGMIGEMVGRDPRRFAGLGMVPLQDPQAAARELEAIKIQHALRGVEIGSNILGRSPGDAFFDPFYAEAERLDLAIFVHALHPVGTERLVGPPQIGTFVNFPIDTALAAASYITGGTLAKFPRLRLAFSHGGGALGAILPRLQAGWARTPDLSAVFASPRETARQFYYDNLVFDQALLRYLIEAFGVTQIFAGSDYPFAAGQPTPGRPFESLGLAASELTAVTSGNALRFLRLEAS
jgi:aminocarboxymuconate-semialdehyde decarboxylase